MVCRLKLLDSNIPVEGSTFPQTIFLVCLVLADGWAIHAHRAGADGQPGEAIGSHRI